MSKLKLIHMLHSKGLAALLLRKSRSGGKLLSCRNVVIDNDASSTAGLFTGLSGCCLNPGRVRTPKQHWEGRDLPRSNTCVSNAPKSSTNSLKVPSRRLQAFHAQKGPVAVRSLGLLHPGPTLVDETSVNEKNSYWHNDPSQECIVCNDGNDGVPLCKVARRQTHLSKPFQVLPSYSCSCSQP